MKLWCAAARDMLLLKYISPCEIVWKISGFDINFREPYVERLSFHLPDQEANKSHPRARCLTYARFSSQCVFKVDVCEWHERKSELQFAVECVKDIALSEIKNLLRLNG
ncbi:uncharacterized protein G2W53_015569 [Senna tora]|uniref:Uncharacterized protein n=1 Tax=Senna tora TaxID=362788 RepID=A0A835C8A9_9FABA|nr:uncharacterized protein G2W53_015569 [Senna tora]